MDLSIRRLGPAKIRSPLQLSAKSGDQVAGFVPDDERVIFDSCIRGDGVAPDPALSFERAGPREMIYFDSSKLRVGIVTCGGLCPGINNVIRAMVMELSYRYGVRAIHGFRYGFAGLVPEEHHDIVDLTPKVVNDIHLDGGSFLGSSRGSQDPEVVVDTLERMGIRLFFTIGGDGTHRGALAIQQEIARRELKIAVVGIPKTIDNDILLVEKTFGFDTAFSIAIQAIRAAHTEAEGFPNGIGLVRLMGRHSGYIAATAAVAEAIVNCVLIPEIPFVLEGEKGLIQWLRKRLETRGHAVIVVAEGAGQELLSRNDAERDPSGNLKLGDIGLFLKEQIDTGLKALGVPRCLKYIDPSYMIRSAPANPNDALFCSLLARHAVHAGMSGRTEMIVGLWNGKFTHVPMREAVAGRKLIPPEGELWRGVLESTGQPQSWV